MRKTADQTKLGGQSTKYLASTLQHCEEKNKKSPRSCHKPEKAKDMWCACPSVHGILQAKILEWVAISFFRGSSQPRDRTQVYLNSRQILYRLSYQGSIVKLSKMWSLGNSNAPVLIC